MRNPLIGVFFEEVPRLIGLREFGPQNIIYYNGSKYSVSQAVVPNVPETFTEARVCTVSGYWLDQDQQHLETCPITGSDLSQTKNKQELKPLMPLCEMLARSKEHITCEEEERLRQGFDIQTYFSLDGGDVSRMRSALVLDQQDGLLKMAYLPAARLIQIAIKDRRQTEEGFAVGLETGRWSPRNDGPTPEDVKRVKIFTETTADALYLQPVQALGLDATGVLSLQYALKRAIELRFQIEPAELGVYSMGNPDAPNILFYEASEGSLGVLPEEKSFLVSFHSPTPEKVAYLGRNHPFVEQLCQLVLAGSLNRDKFAACRASALRSPSVQTATTLLLFRVRNVIEEKKRDHELVAEEMLVWGYRGDPSDNDFLSPEDARSLLTTITPGGPELALERRQRLIDETSAGTDALRPQFDLLAEERCKQLVEAHERFSELVGHRKYQVVYPVLPMDILGLYVVLPV